MQFLADFSLEEQSHLLKNVKCHINHAFFVLLDNSFGAVMNKSVRQKYFDFGLTSNVKQHF